MEEEKKYTRIEDIQEVTYEDTRLLNLVYLNIFNEIDVIYSLIMSFAILLSIYLIPFLLLYMFLGVKFLSYSIIVLAFIPIIIITARSWRSYILNLKSKELARDKHDLAVSYFMLTKEYEQDEWIRNKIFETKIKPFIA